MRIIQTKFELFIVLMFVSGLFVFLFYAINVFNHFDPINLCYIKLEGDIVRGNKETVHKAINLLKKYDRPAYYSLCQNIERISERYCIIADYKADSNKFKEGYNLPGCYVIGTKTIYLTPIKTNTEKQIEERAWAIKKYTEMSKDFWENFNSLK